MTLQQQQKKNQDEHTPTQRNPTISVRIYACPCMYIYMTDMKWIECRSNGAIMRAVGCHEVSPKVGCQLTKHKFKRTCRCLKSEI
jgi:hypothetical protein